MKSPNLRFIVDPLRLFGNTYLFDVLSQSTVHVKVCIRITALVFYISCLTAASYIDLRLSFSEKERNTVKKTGQKSSDYAMSIIEDLFIYSYRSGFQKVDCS